MWSAGIEELHAHLNGSISPSTMEKLIAQKPHLNINHDMVMIRKGQKRTLEECFQMFRVVHQITSTTEDILVVAKDVIKEFAADGVKYLELRSTPREENSTGMSKRSYVEAILEAIRQTKEEGVDIDVRFLLAIDRKYGGDVAKQTVKLAEEFFLCSGGVVVGVDLSGDPNAYKSSDFIEPLREAKNAGLKLALHLAEITGQEDETRDFLSIPPDRIGHGTFLHAEVGGSQELENIVRHLQIPLELCMTSNVKGQTVPAFENHHFGYWSRLGHPLVICTDDKGVFATDLSQEYWLTATTFNLTQLQLWDLSYKAIDYIFASDIRKTQLKKTWNENKPCLFNQEKAD
ncbi:adenosine deaminase-like protein isoform X2 [Protopterus annectens]|uniref:adenosine deaminase-like protein isoform X2 n=1 Tax=Protopterus annectens TaxID=7888 RepID=UPI001CFB3319|nr:adenosine deaminase-like protein isoform X2 [Protopterus annectens]